MADGAITQTALDHARSVPLDEIDVSHPDLWSNDSHWPYFERLRKEEPIHWAETEQDWGNYWSVTRWNDIMAVDTDHEAFSSEPTIVLPDPAEDFTLPMFIAMDPPKHDVQRKTVSPAVSPHSLALQEPQIRQWAGDILDGLPIGEEFDWVDKVSMELTAMMLANLFGAPQEDRRKLTYWSDVATAIPGGGLIDTIQQKVEIFTQYHSYFTQLWNQRVNAEPTNDLISMLAHGESTRNMEPREFFGNVVLLTVGGNDTTRNTISGSVLALNQNPDQYQKLRDNPELIPNMVSETIRWQTPLAHMRRIAKQDIEFGGKTIREGDKVVMWYVSGNRDETVIDNPNAYLIERDRARQHLSFGFGIHRCVGNRLAELQLKIIWEEILKRFPEVKVVGEPKRSYSTFVKGYERLPVVIPSRI